MIQSEEAWIRLEQMVLAIHRRNGGALTVLEPETRLLDPKLGIDSLDLAEIMVFVEREFGASPFNSPVPPRTWADVVRSISKG